MGVKSGAVTFIKHQPLIIVDGPGEDSPEEDCPHHLERSDSGVSDVAMTVNRLMPTETGTPSDPEGACSNHHDQRESGIFEGDGDLARPDTDCNRLSTLSTDSGRPSSMEGILDNILPLHERTHNATEEEWEGMALRTSKQGEHDRDSANNTDAPAAKGEATEQIAELAKKPWRFSKLECSRPRRYSGSPNPSLPPLDNELKDSNLDNLDHMMPRIGSGARTKGQECLKIPPQDQSSDSQTVQQLGTSLPSDDLMTDCASPGVDPPFEENENINDGQDTLTTRDTIPEPATGDSHGTEHGGHDAEDMTYGRITKTWDHDDSCVIMPVYDARGKFSHTGGCLELRYGRTTVRLDVPAGAVPRGEAMELFIRVLPSRGRVEPTAVFCGPHGTVFETHVTLSYSTDDDGGKAAVQGFVTPTDFGDPTRWHDIGDDPDTSFKAEDGMHHFMLKHFTGLTNGANSATKRTNPQQQDHIIKTFHLYHDYQVFQADGKRMTFLILRLYIADEDQAENIKASEKNLGGRLCDAPRCLTFTVDNDNPLQINLTHPFEHAWNFVGPHLQTMDIRTIRGTRLTSCQFRMSSAHSAAAHCNVELSQPGNSSDTLGVNIVPPQQLQCCCQGRPNRQLEYERHCHNNTGYEESDPEDHLQGAVGGYHTASNLPVSQCAEETGPVQQKGKHPVEDACPCEICQDSIVHTEDQGCPTDDTCNGCHLCTEESSSQTSVPTYPGTASEEPHLKLSTEESRSPTLMPTHTGTTPGQPHTHLCTEESSSPTSRPTQPGTAPEQPHTHLCTERSSPTSRPTNPGSIPEQPHAQLSQSHQTGLSTEVPEHHLSVQLASTNQPAQECSPLVPMASHHPSEHPEGSQQNSPWQGAVANPLVPPHQPGNKVHKLLKKLNLGARFAQKLSDTVRKPKTKSKPSKEQASPDVLEAGTEDETKGANSRDTHLPDQEATQATQKKKDSAYISGVPEESEGGERFDPPEDYQHLRDWQRDSGVHGEEKQSQDEGEAEDLHGRIGNSLKPIGDIDSGNPFPLEEVGHTSSAGEEQAVVIRRGADTEKGERESGYTSGVPSMCADDPEVS
uniref:Netrin receptor UNC5 n=1 Tax=Branchiostoma floridae TaxID=7739 RepID=C3XTK0_BRAFL|eukprot:XP_002612617.1 hypothetical protein BRAFLDRAFT_78760 [Branchiostoma floridae]